MANPSQPALNREHLRPGDRLCAAVSGGADSVAMLLLLHQANAAARNALGVGLSAVHVNHGLRSGEADADQVFVEQLCMRLGIPLQVHSADVRERAAAQRETLEEAARGARYEVFRNLIAEGHADSVLTAHTLDDQAETVLMKLLRGAWTEGLSGIHPVVAIPTSMSARAASSTHKPGKIVRPLLAVRRVDLRAYLETRKQPWREDLTNADESFTRNRLRHSVLPVLREENPAIDTALANLAELAREDEARWQAEVARILPQMLLPGRPVRGGGRAVSTAPGEAGVALELERLRGLDGAMRRRIIRAAARSLGARLNFEETSRLLALAGFGGGPGGPIAMGKAGRAQGALHLADGLRAERSQRELRLYRNGG